MAVNITSQTDSSGNAYYSVDPNDETELTLQTGGTYVPADIKFVINGLEASVEDISGSTSKCLVLSKTNS